MQAVHQPRAEKGGDGLTAAFQEHPPKPQPGQHSKHFVGIDGAIAGGEAGNFLNPAGHRIRQ